jgi:zinc and cadmium transporter
MILLTIIIASLFISLISLVGVVALSFRKDFLNKIVFILISISIGALLGGAFLHLIPEALESGAGFFYFILIGFFSFFIIEKIFHWRHCHKNNCKVHSFAYINLLGDSIHNFIDGIIIAAGFLTSPFIGLSTTIAIALHEIPQEFGDFGVLIYAGFSKKKALFYNFLTALTALFGGILGYYFLSFFENTMSYLLLFAAGGFIYIAASDLLPELKKVESLRHTLINFLAIIIGILIIYLVGIIE